MLHTSSYWHLILIFKVALHVYNVSVFRREAQTSNICKQKEDLRERERKLQEGEQRLEEVQQSLNRRVKLADENDRIRRWEHIDLEGAQEKIERANSSLKRKEDDLKKRVEKLTFKEKASWV